MATVIRGSDNFDSEGGVAGADAIIGVGQDWRAQTSRSANTWYHNNSNAAIMVQVYTTSGPITDVGPSTSSYTSLRQSNRDSDYDNPGYIIVPAGFYWRVNGVDHVNSSQYQNILD
jgi:hypothetical protein